MNMTSPPRLSLHPVPVSGGGSHPGLRLDVCHLVGARERRSAGPPVDTRQHLLYYVNVARRRHPSKVIEEAVRYAEFQWLELSDGWQIRPRLGASSSARERVRNSLCGQRRVYPNSTLKPFVVPSTAPPLQ